MKPTNKFAVVIAAAAFACAIVVAGCGPERRREPPSEPFDPHDPQVALGERVFSRHCYQCHPGGASGLGPAINDKPLPVAAIKLQVRQGHFLMPAFSEQEVSDQELEGVVKYLKALRSMRGVGA